MHLFFQIQNLQLLIFYMDGQKVNHFLNRFIILLHLISSFTLTRSFLLPYSYVSMESIDFILLSWFNSTQLILTNFFRKNIVSFNSKLFLCFWYWFIVSYEFFFIFLRLSMLISFLPKNFISLSNWVASKQFLEFSNLTFLFMPDFFVIFAFLSSLPSSIN